MLILTVWNKGEIIGFIKEQQTSAKGRRMHSLSSTLYHRQGDIDAMKTVNLISRSITESTIKLLLFSTYPGVGSWAIPGLPGIGNSSYLVQAILKGMGRARKNYGKKDRGKSSKNEKSKIGKKITYFHLPQPPMRPVFKMVCPLKDQSGRPSL